LSDHRPFHALVDVMARLRAPDGCPWDREQDHQSLKPYLIEEAYEVLEAIDNEDGELCSELGDVLLQVVFHAQVATEDKRFDIDDVCQAIVDKLIRRHPHVFGDTKVDDSEHVVTNWEAIKKQERQTETGPPPSALDGVPPQLPALLRAQRVQEKARRAGFDWQEITGPLDKVSEEFEELREVIAEGDAAGQERVAEEFGDLLFALVNVGRHLDLVPEDALRLAVGKFDDRFRAMEHIVQERGQQLADMDLEAMDAVWNQVKESGAAT
jgi:tetrapyrrole methylase family protein / MazG family protein